MRIYVASSWRNEYQPSVVSALEAAGNEVYDFRNPSMGPGLRGRGFAWEDVAPNWEEWTTSEFRAALRHPAARDGFLSDLEAMRWANALVLVSPCGRSAHLEAGWAIGAQKPTAILLADGERPELMYSLADAICTSIDEVLEFVREQAEIRRALPS